MAALKNVSAWGKHRLASAISPASLNSDRRVKTSSMEGMVMWENAKQPLTNDVVFLLCRPRVRRSV